MKSNRQKGLIGLICVLALIVTSVSVYWHQEMSHAEISQTTPNTGEYAETVGVEGDSAVPDGATGFLYHQLGNVNSTLIRSYRAYASGKLVNQLRSMQYTATAEDDTNGISMNITDYVKTGKSGNVFGASLMINVEDWSAAENKNNKASLFFEVRDPEGAVKKSYPLESDGPDDTGSNLSSETFSLGAGWLTSPLAGEAAIDFEEGDEIFLCTSQKNNVHYYTNVYLWGYVDSFVNASEAFVSTPVMNQSGDQITFTVSNLTDTDMEFIFEVTDQANGQPSGMNEYSLAVPSGTEETPVALKADSASVITIRDTFGKVYVDSRQAGTCEWVGTWTSAQLTAAGDSLPPMELTGSTYRQIIRTSTGGSRVRLTFSNENGESELEIKSAHLARQIDAKSSEIDTSTDTALTFEGKESVVIPAGGTVTSDAVEYPVEALEPVAVTTYFGKVPNTITSHTGARCHNWLTAGNHVSDVILGAADTTVSWYFVDSMDVFSPEKNDAIVCFGDSITDGYGCTVNRYERWTDVLAQLLQQEDDTKHLSVLNKGIGGNAIFGGSGKPGKDRFDNDVLKKAGVKYLIILEGVNDIGYSSDIGLADSIIAEYKTMIAKAHAAGIKVYGGTILPFKGHSYYSVVREQIRKKVNEFILSKDSGFDGTIDFAAAIADSSDPEKMLKKYANDNLHPNPAGYKLMGQLVYDTVFKEGVN